jgi:copper resistance protein D
MAEIISLYAFLAVLLRGASLALEAVTVGGIIFTLVVFKQSDAQSESRCQALLRVLAWSLACVAVAAAVMSALVLRATEDGFLWSDAFHTSFFRAKMLIAIAATAVALLIGRARHAWLLLCAGSIVIGALMTSHAFARIEGRPLLLSLTALHHLATAAWIGGLPFLIVVLRRQSETAAIGTARRFSRLAMVSVTVLIGAGMAMGFEYVGDVNGLYGTSYGAMLVAKFGLLGLLLLLGLSNYMWLRRAGAAQTITRLIVMRSVEVEAAIGIAAILAAASLTSQAPAVDLSEGRVTLTDLSERLSPRWPSLRTPQFALLSPATPLNLEQSKQFGIPLSFAPGARYQPNTAADVAWSDYNHHWAGLCVLMIGVLAMLAQTSWGKWARHWPLGFFGLAIFLLVRADPENWPLGPRGFWESFQVAEVAQHRIFVVLIGAFAIFEWRVVMGFCSRQWPALIFPAICVLGGALLLTHTHSLGNVKEELLAEFNHLPIALLAVTAGGARWLELRLPYKPPWLAFIWSGCFLLIGLALLLYRES